MPIVVCDGCREQITRGVIEVDRRTYDGQFAGVLDAVTVAVEPDRVAELHRCGNAELLKIAKTVRLAEEGIEERIW